MSTITYFTDKQPDYRCEGNLMGVIKNRLDFAAALASSDAVEVEAADVVQAVMCPAGFHALGTSCEVETAEGATCTAKLGVTGDDPNGFDDEVNLNSEGVYKSNITDDAYPAAGGYAFTTEDSVDLLMGHDTDTAVVVVNVYGYFYDWVA